jgi:hypothetical protein
MYQQEPSLFVPYTIFATFVYNMIYFIANDKMIADYVFPMLYNILYLGIMTSSVFYSYSVSQRATIIKHVISALIGHYCADTINLVQDKKAKFRTIYIFHHLVSVQLLYFHYCGMLSLSVGTVFLTLFELSNLFLIPYQLCANKGWNASKYLLAHPMVLTYVPIRLLAIPVCSLFYWSSLQTLNMQSSVLDTTNLMCIYCLTLFGCLNMFSIYYGLTIGYRYYLYLTTK